MNDLSQNKVSDVVTPLNIYEQEWEVEAIINERKINVHGEKHFKKVEYLVKWVGYEEPTWEPIENLENCRELLEEYLKKKKNNAIKNRKVLINDIRTGEILNEELNNIHNNDNNKLENNIETNNNNNKNNNNPQPNGENNNFSDNNKEQIIPTNKKNKKNKKKEKEKDNKSSIKKNKRGRKRKLTEKIINDEPEEKTEKNNNLNNNNDNILDNMNINMNLNTNNNIENINNSNPSNNSFMKASTMLTNSFESEKNNNSNFSNNFQNLNSALPGLDFPELYKESEENDYNFDSLSNIVQYDSLSCISNYEIHNNNIIKNLVEKNDINLEIKGIKNNNDDNNDTFLNKKRYLNRNDLLNDETYDNWINILSINNARIPLNNKEKIMLNITYQFKNSESTYTDNVESINKNIPPLYLARYYEHVLKHKHRGEKICKKVIFSGKIKK